MTQQQVARVHVLDNRPLAVAEPGHVAAVG